MKQEIIVVSQLFLQLKKKYEMSNCTQCLVMQDYFKSEYHRLRMKLQSLEKLSAHNDLVLNTTFTEAQQTAGILGLYVMV
tara:strand:+ start:53081 stop:53320 length:240 start_codon:yes stop_codon:yes gene_type:complete